MASITNPTGNLGVRDDGFIRFTRCHRCVDSWSICFLFFRLSGFRKSVLVRLRFNKTELQIQPTCAVRNFDVLQLRGPAVLHKFRSHCIWHLLHDFIILFEKHRTWNGIRQTASRHRAKDTVQFIWKFEHSSAVILRPSGKFPYWFVDSIYNDIIATIMASRWPSRWIMGCTRMTWCFC